MLPHYLPCRVSRGAATLPHRLPLRSIPPPRFACGASHSRGTWASTVCAEEFPTPLEMSLHGLNLLRHSKSFSPGAPIAYATSLSPPNEAIAWPGRRCLVLDEGVASQGRRCWVANDAAGCPCRRCWVANAAVGCPRRSSCKSPRARVLVLGTSGAHWPARWPRFELTEHGSES